MISSTTSSASFTGNASTSTPYAVPFRFDANAWLTVERVTALGAVTSLTLGVDYTITGTGSTASASVVTGGGAIPGTDTLRVTRNTPLTQTVSLTYAGQIPSATLEAALDKQTMAMQDLARRISELEP